MSSTRSVEIGIFGGTGFYSLMEDYEEVKIDTPYGPPSGKIAVGEISGRGVAFLPRHGKDHSIPPHKIPYLANAYAFKQLGVRRIIAPSACGSLQPDLHPGDFVVSDQFVDRTRGRIDTFYDGPIVTHISTADPYCSQLRNLACQEIERLGIQLQKTGTCVIIQGPRFSTKAESLFFSRCGWHTVNMTQYPEVVLARELEMCYTNISLVTDYDAGVVAAPGTPAATTVDIVAVLQKNNENVKRVIEAMIKNMPVDYTCKCGETLAHSRLD